jgi:general secretion pathway protein E/type IV pilus assembly protein PilB
MQLEGLVVNILKENKILTEDHFRQAEQMSLRTGKSILDIAVNMKWIDEAEIRDIVASKFSMDVVSIKDKEIPDSLINLIPVNMAQRYGVIPVEKKDNYLKIAISDPFKLEVVDSLSIALGMQIEPLLATMSEIERALRKYYGYEEVYTGVSETAKKEGDIAFGEMSELESEIEEEAPVIRLVSYIIAEAFKRRASDIHLEPLERKFRVRYRIDGILYEVDAPPKQLQNSIIARIKIMANMSIDEKRLPQDGRIKLKVLGKDIDLRVSSVPGNHGESIVMRILDRSSLLLGLSQLGFMSEDEKRFKQLIDMPNGIILVTGPTGSGKTTTLYACLNGINRPDKKIITVEDPVEYLMGGINQVQVNEDIDLTFANILRSILRQAPDIIMIGEVRDPETANIAIHASLTGHLVFSTLHTNDAAGAVTRLIDIGVKPFLAASSVQGILAQRLIRTICPKCKIQYTPSFEELKSVGILGQEKIKQLTFWQGAGCEYCSGTGYRGRIGIFELMVINDELRNLIYQKASSTDIERRARQLGMKTLREDALQKVYSGITSLEEVKRVAGEE